MRKRDEQRQRGLPSLNEARDERRRAIVFGRARMPALPPYFWLWVGLGLSVFSVVYWRMAQGQLESEKSAVMAKQRAITATLGPKIYPFRDKIERWTMELAGAYPGDLVTDGTSLERISRSPGVYLRLRLANATSPESIRKAAQDSMRDGFTSCLFVTPLPDTTQAPRCQSTRDCGPGLLCNDHKLCAPPGQPYNLRLAYAALRVLSSDWTDELHRAGSSLAVSAYERDLESATKHDVPIAIDLLTRARYFTLVLDEDPPQGVPPDEADAGESTEERLQRVAHVARIAVWDLRANRALLRLRTTAGAQIAAVGERSITTPANRFAQQRQANNCALALGVKEALDARQ